MLQTKKQVTVEKQYNMKLRDKVRLVFPRFSYTARSLWPS